MFRPLESGRFLIPRAAFVPVAVLCALTALAVLGACGGDSSETTADASAEDSRPASRRFLSLGTAPPGGAFFVVGGAISEVLNEFAGDSGWQVTAEATKGTQENLRRLARGELDLALANSAITYFGVRGEGGWEAAMPVRTVMTLAPNVALFITPQSSDVESIADLRGKRVVLGPAGAGFEYFLRPILGAHGMTYDDLTALNATQAQAVDLLADGAASAAFLGGAVPTASITQAATSQDVRYLSYETEAVDELLETYPFFDRAGIPAGTYRGLEEDYSGMNVGSMHLVTGTDVDEELVYQLTRTIYENRASVVEKHPAGRAINPNVVVRDTGTEFHPGAVRYYREIGIWPGEAPAPETSPPDGDG